MSKNLAVFSYPWRDSTGINKRAINSEMKNHDTDMERSNAKVIKKKAQITAIEYDTQSKIGSPKAPFNSVSSFFNLSTEGLENPVREKFPAIISNLWKYANY